MSSHLSSVNQHLESVRSYSRGQKTAVIDGHSVDVPAVVAVSRDAHLPRIASSPEKQREIADAVAVVAKLALGEQSQYGITTGFGGSATTRTKQTALLQKALIAHCQAGIVPAFKNGQVLTPEEQELLFPQDWIRGVMFVRLNSLIRAQSGTRWIVIEGLYKLLLHDVAPCVPIRQSISASGDLAPLAYISGVLTGHPDNYAWYGQGAERRVYDSPTILQKIGLQPIEFIAKEGLSLINGTGASSAVACLGMHDCHIIGLASQVLSAFAVEMLKGFQEPFTPYLHEAARPHPGQIEAAANIRRVLLSSKLARPHHVESDPEAALRQDRYCLRSVPQWLGPQLEDLLVAQKILDVELNSTTDNPIVDVQKEYLHHGANFMAMAVTSATEKMRLVVHHIAKLMFAQLTELLNHSTNCGLPPNLAVGEPSVDYSLKGADIAAAAYLSEIAYLANPVSTHVVSAEMHNQSINSLALISGRYTLDAVKLCFMLMSTHIFALCQAADLRTIEATFRSKLFSVLRTETAVHLPGVRFDDNFFTHLNNRLIVLLNGSTDQDSTTRFERVMGDLASTFISLLNDETATMDVPLKAINQWRISLTRHSRQIFMETRAGYAKSPDAGGKLLGRTGMLYTYVRGVLGVKMHWGDPTMDKTTIGSEIAKIFRAWKSAEIAELMVRILVGPEGGSGGSGRAKL
ncbi:L-Aspartase-like protein [Pisolithus orientalis]|uniref:L-Aspartase-like protein n=1 Tax=Pisolithus orientalis TaxID=936130 RepID=UPI0022259D13|nr:L-Aspartase-like protein [Pisolithus orientalis]KAI5992013.1 L-Aspartase-like protein [Pisolithus orientalis]